MIRFAFIIDDYNSTNFPENPIVLSLLLVEFLRLSSLIGKSRRSKGWRGSKIERDM